jgi:dCMP deaminase
VNTITDIEKWDKRFLDLANHISLWSKDNSTKVGCVIVRPDKTIASVGYNGFPRGVNDDETRYNDRNLKYMMVKHAEENAIYSSKEPLNGFTAYVTHHPCSLCTGSLIQNGITRIVTNVPTNDFAERFKESFEISKMMLSEAGIELVLINDEL